MIRITAPHFCAGITDGRAAPILQYMKGWTVKRIREYCVKRGWSFEQFTTEHLDKTATDTGTGSVL